MVHGQGKIDKHVTSREGREPQWCILPVTEFGLRISVHNIGDVVTRKSGYDPVRKIAKHASCACDM